MSYGEACLIPGIPVRVRRLALTGGEGRLKGPRGDFLWHLSPRMEDASLGELQPQPLSLRFGVLAQRDPRDPLGGSGGETPFPTLPEDMTARVWGHVEEGDGLVSGGHSAPIGLTAVFVASFAADLALLLCPGPSQLTCCPRDWGMSNEAERCSHRHSPVLVTWLS